LSVRRKGKKIFNYTFIHFPRVNKLKGEERRKEGRKEEEEEEKKRIDLIIHLNITL